MHAAAGPSASVFLASVSEVYVRIDLDDRPLHIPGVSGEVPRQDGEGRYMYLVAGVTGNTEKVVAETV